MITRLKQVILRYMINMLITRADKTVNIRVD